MDTQINSISNLLEHTNLIKKKYDEFSEYTGENFNVFNILGLYSHELSHSAFIGNLLNAKGNHGQKDIFLKLFIEEIKELFEDKANLESFRTSQSDSIVEKYDGRVDYENEKGGRIDIFITDGKNGIGIENKIWAGDQYKQLVRYYQENIAIIYLTLNGKEPDQSSKQDLENGKHFICVSYENHIKNWLEKCIKEMANKPTIRETLNQYLYLVKQLTNQATNNKMAQEIVNKIISKEDNFEAFKTLLSLQDNILIHFLKEKYVPFLKEMAEKYKTELVINEESFCNLKESWAGFGFTNERMKNHKGIRIAFSFDSKSNYTSLIFGFFRSSGDETKDNKIRLLFQKNFGNYKTSEWICYKAFNSYPNWTDLNTLQKLYFNFDTFKQDFEDKFSKMVKIINDTL